jgi:hypothetical protein
MLSKESVFALVVALLALMGYASGLDDNIGQVLLIDGPGGYLPDVYPNDGESLDGYTDNAQIQFYNYGTLMDSSINFNDFLNTISYWKEYFDNWGG